MTGERRDAVSDPAYSDEHDMLTAPELRHRVHALEQRVALLAEALRDARTAIERANGTYLTPGYPDLPGGYVFLDYRALLARLDDLLAEHAA